jgi:hypothetical protein
LDTQGVLYIATGEKYVHAAVRSAYTVLKHCPGLAVHLFTDLESQRTLFEKSPSPFTSTGIIVNPHRFSKVDYMHLAPFSQTLYMDTDTALKTDIRDMFRLLERFDIAMAHMHRRNNKEILDEWRVKLPPAFPQFNSGVVLFRNTPAVVRLLEEWGRSYREAGFAHDQTTLRELLWLSDLRIATLPPEYNVRFLKYLLLWNKVEATPKIFHLKALHEGWIPWINRKTRVTWLIRKMKLGWLVNRVKKVVYRSK